MKKILLALLLLSTSALRAQTTQVSFSKKFSLKDPGLTDKDGGVFRLNDFYYSMEIDYKGMQLAYTAKLDKIKYGINLYKYDLDMKEVKKITLKDRNRDLGPFSPQVTLFGHKILLFYYKVQEDNSIKLLMSVMNPETLDEIASKDLYTISQKNVGLFKISGVLDRNTLLLGSSPDGSKLLVSQSGNTNEIFTAVIDENMALAKSQASIIHDLKDVAFNDCCIDNAGNKYISYSYSPTKTFKRGVLVQNKEGKEAYLTFNSGSSPFEANTLAFKPSNDNSKMYIYANYYGDFLDEGLLLSTVNATQLSIGSSTLFPYPADIKEKLTGLGYGQKAKGAYTVSKIGYRCNELEDGTLAFAGYPAYTNTTSGLGPNGNVTVSSSHAGPLIHIFLQSGNAHFNVLYRTQLDASAGGFISIPYKNKIACLYMDSRKNLSPEGTLRKKDHPDDLVLAVTQIGGDGTVISTKEAAAQPEHLNFFINYYRQFANNHYIIPLGRNRVNMVRYYTELSQWAIVDMSF